MSKGKWRLELLPWKHLSPNLSGKRTKNSILYAMVYTTPGGMVHCSTDLHMGQLLWCPRRKRAWIDLPLQSVEEEMSPELALAHAVECVSMKDVSYVENSHWEPKGPVTTLKHYLGDLT